MMNSDLSKQPYIGKDTEAKLIQAGISTFAELQTVGTEQAFLRLQTLDPGACIQLLYGLEGAIEGVDAKMLSSEKKQELREFHRMSKTILHDSDM